MMKVLSSHPLRGQLSVVVTLLAAACISATEPIEVVTWEAELVAAEGGADPISGSGAMVSGERQTQVGISVRFAPASTSLGWALVEGSCTGPGSRVGPASAYPSIQADDDGDGAAETRIGRRIDTAGPYAAAVYENPDGSGAVLACANLERRP
jgi:hypothetical protein